MSNNLTPKPIIDKNGKATTVRVNNDKGSVTATRKLPAPSGVTKVAKPRPAGTVGGYNIKAYKSVQGREGDAFTCKLYKDGKAILEVSNDGNGGSNRYYPTGGYSGDWKKAETEFHDFAREFNGEDPVEGYNQEGDVLMEYMLWAADVEKHADKIGQPRAQVLEHNIDLENKSYADMGEGFESYIISDEVKARMLAAAAVE